MCVISLSLCYCPSVCLGRRASIDFLKANKDLTKEIETEVRKIMADRLISGGASSSSDEYEEDEEGEGAGENDGNEYGEGDYRQS